MIGAVDFIAPGKIAMAGIGIGVLCGFGVAQLQPGPTLAAVIKDPPLHFGAGKALDTDLFHADGAYYAVGHTPDVSMTPIETNIVRKVGLGRTSFVTVSTTATGTYSTDGLTSPNVRYPGIYSEPLQVAFSPFASTLLGWSRLTGWTEIPLLTGGRGWDLIDDDQAPASRDGVCVSDPKGGCR